MPVETYWNLSVTPLLPCRFLHLLLCYAYPPPHCPNHPTTSSHCYSSPGCYCCYCYYCCCCCCVAGGLTDALQAFVLPPLIYVQMASSSSSNAHALTATNAPINSGGQGGSSSTSGGGMVQGTSSGGGGPKLTPKRRLLCAAITAWGLATMVYTTCKIVQQGWNFESSS